MPVIILLLSLLAVALLFLWRRSIRAEFGPAIALCPGPDQYGYACQSGAGFAYLDATHDTTLYEDDGTVAVDLPFPFTFYGTTYTSVQVSSNGNLQFDNSNPQFFNECLVDAAAPGMGDMIAPYWDDLDLVSFGFLETETFGATPDRIFVVEWDDIPRFGDDSDDRVTFEVQLFETSNDIVFLYENVATMVGYNGSSATIGLQSEAQRLALQYGCDQPVVADASGITFPHPAEPNRELGRESVVQQKASNTASPAAKGHVRELVEMLELWGPYVLNRMRGEWLNQRPARAADWRWLDLTGDGRDELVLLWHGGPDYPQLAQVVVLAPSEDAQMALLLDERLSTRRQSWARVNFLEMADLTGDRLVDIVFADAENGRVLVLTAAAGQPALYAVGPDCNGRTAVMDGDGDGRLDVVRDGCEAGGRVNFSWNGSEFTPSGSATGQP